MSLFSEERILDRFTIWHSTEFKLAGGLIAILGLMFLFPGTFALLVNEDPSPFFYPAIPLITTGLFIFLIFAPSKSLRTVNGLMMVALTWIIMFFVGAIPYLIVGMAPVNALFESVNGFTTTGSTTIESVYYWPLSLMFWRAMSQWLGGIAIVIIFIYLLPLFGMGRLFFNNELEGSGSSQFSMKLQNAAKSFILVYVLLSIINFIILFIVGADLIDAVCLSLTTISTGGVIISNTSMIETATSVQVVTLIFMFIGGTNFYLHFKAIYGRNLKAYLNNKEIGRMALYFIIMSLALLALKMGGLSHLNVDFDNLLGEYWAILFTVVSMGTTTGTTIYDY
ncbi:MAG: TrkH family potassium uptake protein, partial [Candidatus Methanomethylophilaceae archaeon]|nr:TrkH family potassium uptake protein [Candidatus Methanomethylophilaceae archaeon]